MIFFISANYLVPFHDLAQLPAGHDVRNAAVRLDADDLHLANELRVARNHQHAIGQETLLSPDVEHDKIPFRIDYHDLALQARWQFHYRFASSLVLVYLRLQAL